jgi:Fe-S oxidoreductase
MFTDNAKKNADACRFCWMCRHVCPVGLVTGKEIHNARAKGLLVSMESRGLPLDDDSMSIMFECCLCKACTNDCATGFDPSTFILESRTKAVVEDTVPASVRKVLDRALQGSIYKNPPDEKLVNRIKKLPDKADILFYTGEAGRRASSAISEAYMDLLEKGGIVFTALKDEPASGAQLGELMGYVDDVRRKAVICLEKIAETKAKTVVVLDPTDCAFFKHVCGQWGILPDIEFITATEFMWNMIEKGQIIPKKIGLSATYHDPCRLARDLEETEPARKIIEAMGIDLKEMFLNRKLTKCCGGALMHENYKDISDKISKARWMDVSSAGETMLITACPCCTVNFSETIPEGMKTEDIFVLLNNAC